jgi:decaprenylphospho-beta-D-ribofuranose 2-oxidase
MTFSETQVELTNWSKSTRSTCFVYQVSDVAGIAVALAAAREQRLTVIPHGAGHSYTDAALNTGGVVIDVTPMHQILAWDAERGIMRVEPGVTLRQMVQVAWKDGWWPAVSPSTPEVTVGGAAAMNVNGRNAWKNGPMGEHILALDVLFANGEAHTLEPEQDSQLFYAFIGSMGLLGFITSITVQLQRVSSGTVSLRRRPAASLDEIFNLFAEEEGRSDFMEAWLDGFASGARLGRGHITCASLNTSRSASPSANLLPHRPGRVEMALINLAASLGRPVLLPGIQVANRVTLWRSSTTEQARALFPFTYWPPAAFAWYHAMFPQGVETFQAFVPGPQSKAIFSQVLRYSHEQGCMPVWCVIKQHRRDPFLLSYQVDGFSLELNYQRTSQTAQKLKSVLQHMIATVIEAGGKFYLAKDHFLTHDQYRQSIGGEALDAFLQLKKSCDPEDLLQSDLYRRVFQPALQQEGDRLCSPSFIPTRVQPPYS